MNKEYLIYKLADKVKFTSRIDSALFQRYGVKRGLRNEDGSGVLVGLTNIGNVVGYERQKDGSLKPIDGRLYYRGYELKDLTKPILEEGRRFGYEGSREESSSGGSGEPAEPGYLQRLSERQSGWLQGYR